MQTAITGRARAGANTRLALAGIFAILFLPVCVGFWFISRYGVNVPYWDQWEFVPFLDHMRSGTLTIGELFANHGEHRLFFPNVIMVGLARLTKYNTVVEMYVGLVLLTATALTLLAIHRRVFGSSPKSLLAFAPLAWLLFDWRQSENFLWGYQIQFFLMICCLAVCVLCLMLHPVSWKRLVLGLTAAVVGSLSMGAGLLLWPAGLVQLLVHAVVDRSNRRQWWLIAVWVLSACAAFAVCFHNYTVPPLPWPHGPGYVLAHLKDAAVYMLVLIGSPLARDTYSALAVAALVMIISAIALSWLVRERRAVIEAAVPFLVFIGFAVLADLAIVNARMGLGEATALSSRYTTAGNLGVLGVYLLVLLLARENLRRRVALLGATTSLTLLGILLGYGSWLTEIDAAQQERVFGQYALRSYEFQTDAMLKKIYPNAAVVRHRASILKSLGYGVFSEAAASPPAGPCAPSTSVIDAVNGMPVTKPITIQQAEQENVRVDGWAIDKHDESGAHSVSLSLDDAIEIPSIAGLARPDVAQAFNRKSYQNSGFLGIFAASALGPGPHQLSLKISNGSGRYCLSTPPVRFVIAK